MIEKKIFFFEKNNEYKNKVVKKNFKTKLSSGRKKFTNTVIKPSKKIPEIIFSTVKKFFGSEVFLILNNEN